MIQPTRQVVSVGAHQLFRPLLVVAVVAAVSEALLLRIGLRLGPAIPSGVNALPAFAVVEWVGVLALNLGVLAACGLLLLTAAALRHRGPVGQIAALALVIAAVINLGMSLLVVALQGDALRSLHGVATGLAVLMVLAVMPGPPSRRAALGLVGLTQLLTLGPGSQPLAELGAVVAAVAAPWLLAARPSRRDLLVGVVAGLLVTIAAAAQPWGIATVAIWTLGFTMYLPPVLYGAAVASVVVAGPGLRRQPGGGALAAGLLLIWLAGLKLDISAFAVQAVAGLSLASGLASLSSSDTSVQTVTAPEPSSESALGRAAA